MPLCLQRTRPVAPQPVKRHALHLEKGNDVLVEAAVVLELIREVEENVRREGLQLLPEQIEIVENGEMFRGVTEGAERVQDVGLGFPILRLHLRAQILIDRRRSDRVEKREDFEFLFHIYLVRLNLPVNR